MRADAPAERIAGFVRALRREGYGIGVQETLDALRTAGLSEPLDAEFLRTGLRALTCHDSAQWHRFDALFENYWYPARAPLPNELSAAETIDPRLLARRRERRGGLTGLAHAMDPDNVYSAEIHQIGAGASRQNTLSRSDFRFLTDRRDQREIEVLAERLALRIRRRLTRRRREVARGTHIHMRRTLRRNLATGGLPVHLRFMERRREPPRLIWLQDVSHSMASYSPLLTRFGRGLLRVFPHAEAFVFHTRLFRVTGLYREVNADALRKRLEARNELWLGGTRIADSLSHFNRQYAGRYVDRRSIVVILSDGLDSDAPEELIEAVRALRQRAHRILWLNPLLGREGISVAEEFPPALREMLDYVGSAHSLDSLARAAEYLAGA